MLLEAWLQQRRGRNRYVPHPTSSLANLEYLAAPLHELPDCSLTSPYLSYLADGPDETVSRRPAIASPFLSSQPRTKSPRVPDWPWLAQPSDLGNVPLIHPPLLVSAPGRARSHAIVDIRPCSPPLLCCSVLPHSSKHIFVDHWFSHSSLTRLSIWHHTSIRLSPWLPRSPLSITPCTATSASWPRPRRKVSRKPAALPISSRSPRLSLRRSSPRWALPPSPPTSPSSVTPALSKPTMPSSSVSPPDTATSPPSGRPSGTRPASSGAPAASGASWPASSSPPPLSAVAKSPPPSRPCPPSPTTASSMSLSDTPRPSL